MHQRGFTLIELSIVLVIIGLIIGGILVGQTLIEAAELRQQVAQMEKFKTAINTFKLKYGKLPGDIDNAVALGLGTDTNLHNGNGDGKIDMANFSPSYNVYNNMNKEASNLFMHLGNAGLAESKLTGYAGTAAHNDAWTTTDIAERFPVAKLNKNLFIVPTFLDTLEFYSYGDVSGNDQFVKGVHALALVGHDLPNSGLVRGAAFKGALARSLDRKADDGNLVTGNVRAGTTGSWVTAVRYSTMNPGIPACTDEQGGWGPMPDNCATFDQIVWINAF